MFSRIFIVLLSRQASVFLLLALSLIDAVLENRPNSFICSDKNCFLDLNHGKPIPVDKSLGLP